MALNDNPASRLTNGRAVVTTAGTPVSLTTTPVEARWVVITALSTNTGVVVVGGAGVVAASATRTGVALTAGQSVTLPLTSTAPIYLDATVNGEGVSYCVGA